MKINVKYLSSITAIVRRSEEIFDLGKDLKVRDLIREMASKYPDKAFINLIGSSENGESTTKDIAIAIQREGVIGSRRIEFLDGLDTALKDRDQVLLYPPRA